MEKKIRKGVIYFRVSTEEQAEFGVSLEYQKKSCFEYAKRNGIEIAEAFHDDGVSAKTTNREGLQAMLEYCRKNHRDIDCVIVYKVDRLSRNVNDYTGMYILLNKLGIKLISATEAIDSTPTGKYVGNIMAAFAQFDNEVRSERVASCMGEIYAHGNWCWKAPLGYLNSRDGAGRKVVVLDPERASLVRLAFEQYGSGLHSLEEVRRMVNEKGLRTGGGNEISKQNMSKIIGRKFYCGTMQLKGVERKGNHEPLITEELFYRCQELLKGKKGSVYIPKNETHKVFPLRHFALCGRCGRPLTAGFCTGKSGKRYPYYRCYNAECGSQKYLPKKRVEEEFVDYLGRITPDGAYLRLMKPIVVDVWNRGRKEMGEERTRLEKALEGLRKEKTELIAMKGRGLLDDDDFMEELDRIKSRIAGMQMKLEEAETEDFDMEKAVEYVFGFIGRMAQSWNEAGYDSKVRMQNIIFPEKVVYGEEGFGTPRLSLLFHEKTGFYNPASPIVDYDLPIWNTYMAEIKRLFEAKRIFETADNI